MPYELLPDDLTVRARGKIIYVARNPKDVCVSFYHFHKMTAGLPVTGTWNEFLSKFCDGQVSFGDWFTHNLKYWEVSGLLGFWTIAKCEPNPNSREGESPVTSYKRSPM